jgi:hypothetical protein
MRKFMSEDPARNSMSQMLNGYLVTQMLYSAGSLRLADLLSDGPLAIEDLARLSGTLPNPLYRLMRALAGLGIFQELEGDLFAINPVAEYLQERHPRSLLPFALSYGQPWWWKSAGGLLESIKSGETSFDRGYGQSLFEFLEQEPEAAEIFNNNMRASTSSMIEDIFELYDFSSAGLIVDIGGGHGGLTEAIITNYRENSAVIFDLPSVISEGKKRFKAIEISAQIKFISGSFFDYIPSGGDLYCLKDILHDWNDEQSLNILHNCRKAIGAGGKLCIIERIIPEMNEPSPGKLIDIVMLILTGGRERTKAEYSELLTQADFKVTRIQTSQHGTSVIEAVPSDKSDT